jgi:hypothetical protein
MKHTILSASIALAVAATPLTGCVSYSTDAPRFQELEAPEALGVVYVMRPASQLGMLQSIKARLDDERWFLLYPGSYGAFYVKPGKTKLRISIDTWASAGIFGGGAMTMAVSGVEVDAQATDVEVDIPPGGAVYVEASFGGWKEPPDASVVSPEDARSEIEYLHLAAGGRPRLPRQAAAQAAPAEQPHAATPSAKDELAALAREVEGVTRACHPNPVIEGTCDVTAVEAKHAIATARAAADRVRSSDLGLGAAKAFLAFSSMLEAIETDRSEGRPVTPSKIGALTKAMRNLEAAANEGP